MNFQQSVTRLTITACQEADRRWVKYLYYLYSVILLLLLQCYLLKPMHADDGEIQGLLSTFYDVCVCAGVQDMVGGRMGEDTGRNIS